MEIKKEQRNYRLSLAVIDMIDELSKHFTEIYGEFTNTDVVGLAVRELAKKHLGQEKVKQIYLDFYER